MRTKPEFILNQPRLHFAAYMRHTTPQAVSIPIPAGELEHEPQLTDDEYRELRERNRDRVCGPRLSQTPPEKGEDTFDW